MALYENGGRRLDRAGATRSTNFSFGGAEAAIRGDISSRVRSIPSADLDAAISRAMDRGFHYRARTLAREKDRRWMFVRGAIGQGDGA